MDHHRKRSYSSSEDEDFCIVCMQFLPKRLTKQNSVECSQKCNIVVHLKCAKINAGRFTCEHCQSDDEPEQFGEED